MYSLASNFYFMSHRHTSFEKATIPYHTVKNQLFKKKGIAKEK